MSELAKGGRGKKAPYNTAHYRMPEPLKPLCEELSANYRELITEYTDPHDPALITAVLGAIIGGNQTRQDSQRINELLQQHEQLKVEMEELHRRVERFKDANQVIALLTEALKLRANTGGAIKEKIKQALALIS